MARDELNESQRAALADIVHYALVEIRRLGWQGQNTQAADLADAVESLPREMVGTWDFSWRMLRQLLVSYQQKYPKRSGVDFVTLVDNAQKGIRS